MNLAFSSCLQWLTRRRLLQLLALLLAVSSCTAYKLDEAQMNLRSSFAARDFDKSAELLNQFEKKRIYRSKDQVLLQLERGTVLHFSGHPQASAKAFTEAEDEIDRLFTKSISRGLKAMLTNDNALAYDGEDYEDIYLNAFKSLDYIKMGDLENALVEARRMAHKLEQLDIKYKGLAEAMSKADTLKRADWKAGKTNFQNSAFSHFLAAVLYAKAGKPDDARIETEKLRAAFDDQPNIYNFSAPEPGDLQLLRHPEEYNVLVTTFSGRAPRKEQQDFRLFLQDPDMYLKFSLPRLVPYPTQVARVRMVLDDTLTLPVPMLEDMDAVATEVYKVKEPIIYARAFTRAILKAIGNKTISKSIRKKDKTLGGVAAILGIIGQEASEKADLRSWQTMPGQAYAQVIDLPVGTHSVNIEYISHNETVIFTDSRQITIDGERPLQLVESLYWN